MDFRQEQAKKLKIVLVYPPTRGGVRSLFTFHKNDGIGPKPPLGILILATYLKQQGFTDVHCFDTQLDELTPRQTAEQVAAMRPDVVGLSAWTDFWFPTWETARLLRELLPDATLVMGGPHCLCFPHEVLEHSAADYVVSGDGEETLAGLLTALSQGNPVPDLPGLWRRENGRVLPPDVACAVVSEVDAIPAPDRDLLPYRRYSSILTPNDFETTMITSRGCPHKCVFCKMHAQKVYARSAEKVVEEFASIAAMGIGDIQVYDDTFTWSRERVMDICHGIIERQLNVRWAIRDRVNRADPEMYALMRKAGCYRIHFGVESGSPPILSASGKGITLEQADRAISIAKSVGMDTLAFYMFGFLDETLDDARKTIEVAIRLDSHYAVFAVLIPYPGTKLYDEALARGIIPSDFWREFTINPRPDFSVPYLIEQHITREALISLKDEALRRYYFRPKAILRELRNLSSPKEFVGKAKMAWNILSDSLKNVRQ